MAHIEAIKEFIRATGIDPAPFARAFEEKMAPFARIDPALFVRAIEAEMAPLALALREHRIPLAELFQRRIPDLYRAAENAAAFERSIAHARLFDARRAWPAEAEEDAPKQQIPMELRPASPPAIREALHHAYDNAQVAGEKPPNVNEVVHPVQQLLQAQGRTATKLAIQKEAEADQFKRRRLQPGRHRPR